MASLLLVLGLGTALLLDAVPWFRRRRLADRLGVHVGGGPRRPGGADPPGAWWLDLVRPSLRRASDGLGALLGVTEPLEQRLRLAGRDRTADEHRLDQLGHAIGGLAAGALVAVVVHDRPVVALTALVLGPLAALGLHERRLAEAVADRRRRLRLELPVVAEQLALLVASGSSLAGALNRLAARGSGVVAEDLGGVVRRVRHGVGEVRALQDWAEATGDDAVRRLVGVLALHREAADLAPLIANEARSAREEAHRELVEAIERRAQLVWVPVTVATLVPGLLFLTVPFVAALTGVTGT